MLTINYPVGNQGPFEDWLNLTDPRAVDALEQQDAPPRDVFVWVRELSLIPSEILPPGPREPSPVTIERSERTQIDVDGPRAGADSIFVLQSRFLMRSLGRPLKQNHCASTFHRLTLDSADVASDVWFILEASHAHQMEGHLSALSTASQPIFMATSELLSSPFPVYRHAQRTGDLLVIPPRWYVSGVKAVQDPDSVPVMRRIFGKEYRLLSRGHACRSMVWA